MKIEQIDNSKVVINLCSRDMEDYKLEYEQISFQNNHSRKILVRLLRLVCSKTGFTIADKTMFVEAVPHADGCTLLVTFVDNKKKKYKIKRPKECICFSFGNLENLIESINILYRENLFLQYGKIYFFRENYYFVFDFFPVPTRAKHILNEFGCRTRCSKIFLSRLKEAGKSICLKNPVETFGKAFAKDSLTI